MENLKPGMKLKKVGHLKMTVIDVLKADTITKNVKEQVEQTADIISDDSTSYTNWKNMFNHTKHPWLLPKR